MMGENDLVLCSEFSINVNLFESFFSGFQTFQGLDVSYPFFPSGFCCVTFSDGTNTNLFNHFTFHFISLSLQTPTHNNPLWQTS